MTPVAANRIGPSSAKARQDLLDVALHRRRQVVLGAHERQFPRRAREAPHAGPGVKHPRGQRRVGCEPADREALRQQRHTRRGLTGRRFPHRRPARRSPCRDRIRPPPAPERRRLGLRIQHHAAAPRIERKHVRRQFDAVAVTAAFVEEDPQLHEGGGSQVAGGRGALMMRARTASVKGAPPVGSPDRRAGRGDARVENRRAKRAGNRVANPHRWRAPTFRGYIATEANPALPPLEALPWMP